MVPLRYRPSTQRPAGNKSHWESAVATCLCCGEGAELDRPCRLPFENKRAISKHMSVMSDFMHVC